MDAQLEELLTRYGPIGGIWFDGMWDKPTADWRLQRTYSLIHRLQPSALIVPTPSVPGMCGGRATVLRCECPR